MAKSPYASGKVSGGKSPVGKPAVIGKPSGSMPKQAAGGTQKPEGRRRLRRKEPRGQRQQAPVNQGHSGSRRPRARADQDRRSRWQRAPGGRNPLHLRR